MSKITEQQAAVNSTKQQNDSTTQAGSLQNNRAAILEKHQKETKTGKSVASEKEKEIQKIKEEINKLKSISSDNIITPNIFNIDEYAQKVEKTLFNFRNEINSPINSIEYSSENLHLEFERIINYFNTLSYSAYPTEALGRAFAYVNTIMSTTPETIEPADAREKKKKFIALLEGYNILNSKRAAEFFISNGVYFVDDELFWILSQPKGEILFEFMISLLSINQSFEILNDAKSRTRFLTGNLIIPSEKEISSTIEEEITAEEQVAEKKLKRKIIFNELKPFIKVGIIVLNLYAVLKMIFHWY